MSFIRALEGRYYSLPSKISAGLYVFPTEDLKKKENLIEFCGRCTIPSEDFVEVMFRILKRCSIGFNLDDVNRVRKILFLKPIKKIATDWEVNRQYFSKSFFDEKGMFKVQR